MRTWILVLLAACTGSPLVETGDDSEAADVVDSELLETDAQDSEDGLVLLPATCDATVVDAPSELPAGDCVDMTPGGALLIRAYCTDPAITAVPTKRHMLMMPDAPSRAALWVHLPGSGGSPSSSTWLGRAAVESGYRFVALAYPNDDSVGSRCMCPDGPREVACEERVRTELLYGVDTAPYFEVEADESIVHRLEALLAWLDIEQPERRWSGYLDDDGHVLWDRIAVSGFSQGGGMAGMIARDHAVDRAVYMSKGGGSALTAFVDPSLIQPCDAHESCASGVCCPLDDLRCDEAPAEDGFCVELVPVPWTSHGPDTDGDALGDGPAIGRATPSERQFGLIHRDEPAWAYSPEAFEGWGMGGRSDYIDLDTEGPPFEGQLWSTGLPPDGPSCSEHQAMGPDACLAKDADGVPVLYPAWRWIMTREL